MTIAWEVLAGASLQELPFHTSGGDVTGYKLHGKHLDVDQSGVNKTFAVDMVWNLHAMAPEFLSLEPRSPSSLLVMFGREKITAILRCNSGARTLCVAEDPDSVDGGAGGAALFVCLCDGSVLAWAVCPIQTPWQRS